MSKVDMMDDKPLPYDNDRSYWEARESYYSSWSCCLRSKARPDEIPTIRRQMFEETGNPPHSASDRTNNVLQMATIAVASINIILNIVLVVFSFLVSTVCLTDRIFVSIWLFFNIFLLMLYFIYRFSDTCCGKPKRNSSTQFKLSMVAFIISCASLQAFYQAVCQASSNTCALSSWALINNNPENAVVQGLYATCFSLNGVVLILTLLCMSRWWIQSMEFAVQSGAKKIPLELRDLFVSTYPRLQAEMVDKYTGNCGGWLRWHAK